MQSRHSQYEVPVEEHLLDTYMIVKPVEVAQNNNVRAAQQALYHRAKCNQAARRGEYNAAMEDDTDNNASMPQHAPQSVVAVFPQSIGVNIHETELQNLLNAGTLELINLGVADRIARKYDPNGVNFVVPAPPFQSNDVFGPLSPK